MADLDLAVAAAHRHALLRFGEAVARAEDLDAWDAGTPCPEWSARDLVEHVIGFHEVLLLRPFDIRALRPRSGTPARWAATAAAIGRVLDGEVDAHRADGAPRPDLARLVPVLTADVVVHTWDLERAIGGDETLPGDLIASALATLMPNATRLAASGMFAAPVHTAPDADPQTRLLALTGRDPSSA